jgi:predicted nucleic-acid-binding protein
VLAVDTNVIVRYLTGDDPQQSARARIIVENNDIFVSTTVLLETEWVLRGAYRFAAAQVLDRLRAFAGLPRVALEDEDHAARALDLAASGIDFADALHLVHAIDCEAFVTFDERLVRRTSRLRIPKVRVP